MIQCENCGAYYDEGQQCISQQYLDIDRPNISNNTKLDYFKYWIKTIFKYPFLACFIGIAINIFLGRSIIGFLLPIYCSNIAAIFIVIGGFWVIKVKHKTATAADYFQLFYSGSIHDFIPKPIRIILAVLLCLFLIASMFTGFF